MSKLLKLKPWLSIPDAAQHLSMIFEEEVRETDLLRFALDGKLTLSVVFLDAPFGMLFEPVADEDIEFRDVPSLDGNRTIRIPTKPLVRAPTGFWLQKQEKAFPLEDDRPYALAMIGGEIGDLRHRYRNQPLALVQVVGVFAQSRAHAVRQARFLGGPLACSALVVVREHIAPTALGEGGHVNHVRVTEADQYRGVEAHLTDGHLDRKARCVAFAEDLLS